MEKCRHSTQVAGYLFLWSWMKPAEMFCDRKDPAWQIVHSIGAKVFVACYDDAVYIVGDVLGRSKCSRALLI